MDDTYGMGQVKDTVSTFFDNPVIVNAIVGGVIVVIALVVTSFTTAAIRRLLTREGAVLPANSIFVNIARAVIWICALSIYLSTCFNFDLTALLGALGIGGLAVSLGCQGAIANLFAGLQISLTGTVKPGDYLDFNGKIGVVRDVNWRNTTLLTANNEKVVIPNSLVTSTSYLKLPERAVVQIPLFVSNETHDLEGTVALMKERIEQRVPGIVLSEASPKITFSGTTEYAFKGTAQVEIEDASQYAAARNALVLAVAPFVKGEEA